VGHLAFAQKAGFGKYDALEQQGSYKAGGSIRTRARAVKREVALFSYRFQRSINTVFRYHTMTVPKPQLTRASVLYKERPFDIQNDPYVSAWV
jgi:hypothetical protein